MNKVKHGSMTTTQQMVFQIKYKMYSNKCYENFTA